MPIAVRVPRIRQRVKSADTLWNRLLLDLNRASEAVGRSIAELREIVSGLKAVFLAFCT